MDNTSVRKWVLKYFKLNGFSVRAEAAAYLASQLAPLEEDIRQKWISKIIRKIQDLNLDTLAINKEHLEICLEECAKKQPSSETIFSVISGFEIPSFRFDPEKNKFLKDPSFQPELYANAPMKSYMCRRRYAMILQRVQRHKMFKKKSFGEAEGPTYDLKTAEWFLCSSGKIDRAVMLGLLVQRGAGLFELEDTTGAIRMDLSECKFREGLITEHCFVLAEGVYDDKVFYAAGIANPPAELAKISRPYFGNLNTFGGLSETSLTQSVSLFKIQNENPDAMIIFLSDVWLDDFKVLAKLKTLLEGFEGCPPIAFVLLGNFLSTQAGPAYAPRLKAAFRTLADLIAAVPSVCARSHFVLLPGPADPGSPLVFPRPALPKCLTEDLRQRVPHLALASNPCRIQYCTREIVVIREDLLTKMCRNAVHFPSEGDIPSHFTRTVVCNATLAPMSVYTWPTHWAFSSALDLYPLPDLVVVGDQFNPFTAEHSECQITNPGSFRRNGFSFRAYVPATNQVEESMIPDENG